MIRLQGKVELLVYSDDVVTNNPKSRLFDQIKTLSDDTLTQFPGSGSLSIADGTVDKSIEFYSTTDKYLFIFTDQEISIKLNGGSDSLKVIDFLVWKGEFTSLLVSNSSGFTANVTIGFGG